MAGIPINGTLTPNGPFPIIKGDAVIGVRSNATRPAASSVDSGFIIANSDTGTLQWSDGTNWHEAISYDPSTNADWPEGVPTTVSDALDTLAARDLKVATVSGGGTLSVDFAVNKYVILQLGSTATTALTATNGINGELYTLRVAQDSSGSRTVGAWPSNFYFDSDDTPTLTTIGSKSDTFLFVYDGATSHYYQVGGKSDMGPSS